MLRPNYSLLTDRWLLAWCWLSQQRREVFSSGLGLVVSIPMSEGERGHQNEIQAGGQGNGQTGDIFLDRHLQVSESCCRKESVLTDHEG